MCKYDYYGHLVDAVVIWTPSLFCRNNCWYCPQKATRTAIPDCAVDNTKQNVDRYVKYFDSHGTFVIMLSGGEPFQFEGFTEITTRLTKKHSLVIHTSLSEDVTDFVNSVDPNKMVFMRCGINPTVKFDVYLDRIKTLKDKGFKPIACFPCHSQNLKRLPELNNIFSKLDIGFEPSMFTDENCHTVYTAEERNCLSKWMTTRVCQRQIDWERNYTTGLNCITGWRNFVLDWDGKAYRCVSDRAGLGNLYNNTLDLLKSPTPCNATVCSCRNYYYDEVAQIYNGKAKEEQLSLARGYVPPLGLWNLSTGGK